MTAAPRPGWYPDPAGAPDQYRWWTGRGWSGALTDTPGAPAPSGRTSGSGGLRTALLLTLGFTLFVGASVGAGVLLWREPSTSVAPSPLVSPAGAASAGAATAGPSGQLDLHTRMATIGQASATLPDEPYELSPDPHQVPGLFDIVFMADAPVHERYDGAHTWSATVMLARLSTSVSGNGLEQRGQHALRQLSLSFFDQHPTALAGVRWSDRSVRGCSGVLMTGRVDYTIAHLPSRYDIVTAQLVELPDATVAVAVTSVPDDADPGVVAQAATALRSLTVG